MRFLFDTVFTNEKYKILSVKLFFFGCPIHWKYATNLKTKISQRNIIVT